MNLYKYLKLLPLIVLIIACTISCEDEPEPVFFASQSTPITLEELTITLIELDGNNPNNPAVTFNWNNADFSQAVVENYAVEFSSTQDFTNSVVATSASGVSSVTMSTSQLNSAVGNAGLDPLVLGTVYARVVASLGSQGEMPMISNVIDFDVIPFFNYIFNDIYIVGSATSPGWENNNNNPPLFRDPNNSNIYNYTGFFDANSGAEFKVLDIRGEWAPQWGLGGAANTLSLRPNEDEPDPPNLPLGGDSGYYTLTVDLGGLEYTIAPFTGTVGPELTSVTIQGSALSANATMTQLSFDPHIWYINSVSLVPGDLQFSTNTGATWAGTTSFSGVATEGTDTIPVIVEDDYEIWFNDITGDYIMIPLNL